MTLCLFCVVNFELKNPHGYLSAVDFPALVVSGRISHAHTHTQYREMHTHAHACSPIVFQHTHT